MSAVYLGTFEPGTPQWRAHRADKIGGSDVAAILGLTPKWMTAFTLWHERRGLVEPQETRPQMTWGTLVEPVVAQFYADQHPDVQVTYRPGDVYAHPDRPWQVCSPDALIHDHDGTLMSGLEVKTARFDDLWGKDGSADIPAYYATQVQWCMDVMGLSTWHVAVLFAGSEYREYVVPANPSWQEALRETASDFLDSLEQGRVPPIDGGDTTYTTIRELHPDISEEEIEVGDLGRAWVEACRTLAAAEDAHKESRALLADFMGDARRATLDGTRIATRQGRAGSTPFVKAVTGLLEKVPAA